jgi:hypothetical protein
MWQRDAPAVYQALSNTQWSENVAPIMKALIGKSVSDKSSKRHTINMLFLNLIHSFKTFA